MSHLDCCVFCLTCRGNISDPSGRTCTYGMGHEFPEPVRPQQPLKHVRDPKLCLRCGLHPRNPVASTNGCAHEFEAV